MREEDVIVTSVDSFVTETVVDTSVSTDTLIALLRKKKATGQLTVHLSQGGIQKIVVTEKTRTDSRETEKISHILWNGKK